MLEKILNQPEKTRLNPLSQNAARGSVMGALDVAPGQITDDGELTLALCHALIGQDAYPVQRVAQQYRRWALTCDTEPGHARPQWLQSRNAKSLLCALSP